MPSSSCTNTSWQWSTHSPSPVHRSWSIHASRQARYRAVTVVPWAGDRTPRQACRTRPSPPDRRRRGSRSSGCVTATTPTRSPISRPRTTTPTHGSTSARSSSTNCSRRSSRGSRRPTSPLPSRSTVVRQSHRGRPVVPDPLPGPLGGVGGGRPAARRERRSGQPRLLRGRRLRDQPRPPPAGLVGRHRRPRALHAASAT